MARHRALLIIGTGVVGLGAISFAGQDPAAIIGNVFLQDITPGTRQIGHAHIGGTFRAGQVMVQQASPVTTAVVGNNTAVGAGNVAGGSFSSGVQSGYGVKATATSNTGSTFGVYAESRSPNGIGVKGVVTAPGNAGTTNIGVRGEAQVGVYGVGKRQGVVGACNTYDPTYGSIGVYGFSSVSVDNPRGMFGQAYTEPGYVAYGVFGNAYGTGTKWGLYSDSNMAVVGTKSFEIDHPLDPEGKTLRHYCAEGEKPLLVYQGEVQLDKSGKAVVRVAEYVEAIGKDFGYQLTPVGSSMPGLFVSRRFSDGAFSLAGGTPGGSVSWTLTGTRNDRWVQKNGAPVEVPKPAGLARKYLRPELYGQPENKGAFYNPDRVRLEQAR